MGEIYLDIVFAVNFIMDWLILWSVAQILKLAVSCWRLTGGAFIGALYAMMLLLPPLHFLANLGVKILFSLIIIAVAFPWQTLRFYIKVLSCFYLISFLAGGAVLGTVYLTRDMAAATNYNGILALMKMPVPWLMAGFVVLVSVSRLGASLFRKHLLKTGNSVLMVVCFGNQRINTNALVDTGNQLRDPLSKHPVIIVEYSLLEDLLPEGLNNLMQTTREPEWDRLMAVLAGTPWEVRIRVLPFHSLGTRQGMLLGLVPDGVYLTTELGTFWHNQIVVGIYQGSLCSDGKYQALLHPELLQMDLGAGKGVA